MAAEPISNLNGGVETVTVDAADLLATVDVSDTTQAPTGTTKPIAISKLTTFFNSALSFLSSVNLGYTASPTNGTVTNDGGTDSTIPLFDTATTNAGLVAGSNGATTTFLRADGTWAAASGGSGVCGISDPSGVYTYYATLTLAMADAVSGDVIELFANITETTNLAITLKNGVNINFNGYTYTLNTTGTASAFISPTTGDLNCSMYNGKIIRTGGNANSANSAGIISTNNAFNLKMYGMVVESTFGMTLGITGGSLYGGTFINALYLYNVVAQLGCKVFNITLEGFGQLFASGGDFNNISIVSTGSAAITGTYNIWDSKVISTANAGMFSTAPCNVYNCYVESTFNNGIYLVNSLIKDSIGKGVSGFGIQNSGGSIVDCEGISTGNVGIISLSGEVTGCIARSAGNYCYANQLPATYVKCIAINTFNSTGGGGFLQQSASGTRYVDCYAEVVNVGAFAIASISLKDAVVVGLKGKGMTALFTAVNNVQASVEDVYGNSIVD